MLTLVQAMCGSNTYTMLLQFELIFIMCALWDLTECLLQDVGDEGSGDVESPPYDCTSRPVDNYSSAEEETTDSSIDLLTVSTAFLISTCLVIIMFKIYKAVTKHRQYEPLVPLRYA
ncbi:hypothetical protein L9F63_008765 [Diploptera punctata]|uniref:Uncharacterized protein n=1 Tax=Diploptera punctata TaxID=6984 RepID=A0AAD7Z4W7_DIPPU|nr:hypothetical protein L9F63_008765 [Diploptera punctata]